MTTPLFNPYKDMPAVDLKQSFEGIGQAISDLRQRREAEQLKIDAQQKELQYRTDLEQAFSDPSAQSFAMLTAKYPQQRDAFKQAWEMSDKSKRDDEFKAGVQAFTAIEGGNLDVARNLMDQRIQAMTDRGEDVSTLSALRQNLDRDPKSTQFQLGLVLSSIEPDKFTKIAEERRKAQMQPLEMQQKSAETQIKDLEAQFAPKRIKAEVGLLQAQGEQASALASRTRAETERIGQEIEGAREVRAGGGVASIIPVDKKPDYEMKLRNEYNDRVKNYLATNDAFRRIESAEPTGPGDMAIIFNYVKMLDPTSTVSPGEQITAQNAPGVSEKVAGELNRFLSQGTLSKQARKEYFAQARLMNQKAQESQKQIKDGIGRIAKGYGLNVENVFYELDQMQPQQQPQPSGEGQWRGVKLEELRGG